MYTGSCLCGAIEYAVVGTLESAVNCYCLFCRKAHGAPYVTVAFVPLSKLDVCKGNDLLSEYEIANLEAFRCFCSICGTRLFNRAPGAGMASVITATLVKCIEIEPLANINTESLPQEVKPQNGLPNFSSMPTGEELKRLLEERKSHDHRN